MIQVTAAMRVLVAIEPVDLRKGIDGLVQLCREKLAADPFSGCLFIFRSRRGTAIKALCFDGQGYPEFLGTGTGSPPVSELGPLALAIARAAIAVCRRPGALVADRCYQ